MFVQEALVAAVLFFAQEGGLGRDDHLFTSRRGGHITKQRADQVIRRAAGRAGLDFLETLELEADHRRHAEITPFETSSTASV